MINIVSVGDSEAEMQAVWLAAIAHCSGPAVPATPVAPNSGVGHQARRRPTSAPPGPNSVQKPWIKTLKLRDAPTIDQIIKQLETLKKCLPRLVSTRSHMRVDPEDLAELTIQLPGLANGQVFEDEIEDTVSRML